MPLSHSSGVRREWGWGLVDATPINHWELSWRGNSSVPHLLQAWAVRATVTREASEEWQVLAAGDGLCASRW